MTRALILSLVVMASLSISTAQARHRSSFGFGVGSGNFGLYYGRGGGFYGPGYYGPGYGGPGYLYGPRYYGYGSGYYGSPYLYSAPNYYIVPNQVYSSGVVITPSAPSRPAAPQFDGGPIVLTNPATNDHAVEYSLNGTRYTMKPGQSQKFSHDRDWRIEFARAEGHGFAAYGLKAATYKFKSTDKGWELFEQAAPAKLAPADDVPPPRPAEEPLPKSVQSPAASAISTEETVIRPRQR